MEASSAATLTQTIYVSSATELFSDGELRELLRKAREFNASVSLTGMLLYKDGNFMQVLEGPAAALDDLVAKITRDPRHRGVIVLSRAPIQEREFGEWSMGFVDATALEEQSFSPFLLSTGKGWSSAEARRGKRLLQGFKAQMR